jgi:nucleotide-binding universal stress UspA family protein
MDLNIRRILVPTDFGALSEQAVQYAAGLAANLGAAVRVLHVVDRLLSPEAGWTGPRDRGRGTAPPSA